MTRERMTHRFGDPDWCEAEYNPRLRVKDAASFAPAWTARAEAARRRLTLRANLRYGAHRREVFDHIPARNPKGTVIFIHGGYWRAFSKDEFTWIAEPYVLRDISVMIINYPLCPDVTVQNIASSCEAAIATYLNDHATDAERSRVVVSGHSAGGYLTAAMLATDWSYYGVSQSPFVGAVPVSGVFDLRPLVRASMNEQIRLSDEQAALWSLLNEEPLVRCPIVPMVGALESDEFIRQSFEIADAWPAISRPAISVANRHHFDVIEAIAEPGQPVFETVFSFFSE